MGVFCGGYVHFFYTVSVSKTNQLASWNFKAMSCTLENSLSFFFTYLKKIRISGVNNKMTKDEEFAVWKINQTKLLIMSLEGHLL